jgi:hypothetical protein
MLEKIFYRLKQVILHYLWGEMEIMNFYEKLPNDVLSAFYYEIMRYIEKGILSKNMHYELGLMISVASQRGITLGRPCDFDQIVDQKEMEDYIQFGA